MAISDGSDIEVAGDVNSDSKTAYYNDASSDFIKARGAAHEVILEEQEDKNLSRSLTQRHIQMIALAGAIVCTCLDTIPIQLLLAYTSKLGNWTLPQSWRSSSKWRASGSTTWVRLRRRHSLRSAICTW
jgi:hypothetical protein